MRGSHFVLMCCLMFTMVMLMGLGIQSCKSKKTLEMTSSVKQSEYGAYSRTYDSLMFSRLMERNHRSFNLELRRFKPVTDTAGNVVGTILDEQVQMVFDESSDVSQSSSGSVTAVEADTVTRAMTGEQQIDKTSDMAPFDFTYIAVILLLMIVLIFIIKH